jgi:hypothetical protein
MIVNTTQLAISLAHCLKFSKKIIAHDTKERPPDIHPLLWQAQRDGMASQLHDIQSEVNEFISRVMAAKPLR